MKKLLNDTIDFCDDIISHSQPESVHCKRAMIIKSMAVDRLLDYNYFAHVRDGLAKLKKEMDR